MCFLVHPFPGWKEMKNEQVLKNFQTNQEETKQTGVPKQLCDLERLAQSENLSHFQQCVTRLS